MSTNMAVLLIAVGLAAIVLGLTVKQFYAAKGNIGSPGRGKPIARWKGQVLFVVIGIVFLALGIGHFFVEH